MLQPPGRAQGLVVGRGELAEIPVVDAVSRPTVPCSQRQVGAKEWGSNLPVNLELTRLSTAFQPH